MAKEIETYFDRLWPLNRSIMGEGFRQSLDILEELVPFERLSFKSGHQVLDWTVPKEWKVNKAYFVGPDGKKYCDFHENNLSLVGYSVPFSGVLPLTELREHIYTLPDKPDAIPYITSYYKERWGFCMTHEQFQALPDGEYQVTVNTELFPGELQVGEAVLPGSSDKEILFSTYLCHPSMANNELSGPLALSFLYKRIAEMPDRKFTYRFVLGAETIGTICYLSCRGDHLRANMIAGYVMTCLADRGNFTYKKSRNGDGLVDRMALKVLQAYDAKVLAFNPGDGSDERQYCSPGYDLPVGSVMRTKYGDFEEYHTSLDNKEFISFQALAESVDVYVRIVEQFENEPLYVSTAPFGEPQLGRRGLYRSLSTKNYLEKDLAAIFWVLNMADGKHDMDYIAEKSGIEISVITAVAKDLKSAGLLTC